MTTCNKCGVELTDANWPPYRAGRDNRCTPCVNAYNREYTKGWRKTPAGRRHAASRAKVRQDRYLATRDEHGNRRSFQIEGKRPRTDACEMCCKEVSRLVYHHWDDDDYSLGLWLCQHCHNAAHVVESGRDELYKSAKADIHRRGLTVISGTTK